MSVTFDEVSVDVDDRRHERAERAELPRAKRERAPEPHLLRRSKRELDERDARLRAH